MFTSKLGVCSILRGSESTPFNATTSTALLTAANDYLYFLHPQRNHVGALDTLQKDMLDAPTTTRSRSRSTT